MTDNFDRESLLARADWLEERLAALPGINFRSHVSPLAYYGAAGVLVEDLQAMPDVTLDADNV